MELRRRTPCERVGDRVAALLGILAVATVLLSGAWGFVGVTYGLILAFMDCTAKASAAILDVSPAPEAGRCHVYFGYGDDRRRGTATIACPQPGSGTMEICYCARNPGEYSTDVHDYFPARAADAMWQSGAACLSFFLVCMAVVAISRKYAKRREDELRWERLSAAAELASRLDRASEWRLPRPDSSPGPTPAPHSTLCGSRPTLNPAPITPDMA